jgi:hypothetical protein
MIWWICSLVFKQGELPLFHLNFCSNILLPKENAIQIQKFRSICFSNATTQTAFMTGQHILKGVVIYMKPSEAWSRHSRAADLGDAQACIHISQSSSCCFEIKKCSCGLENYAWIRNIRSWIKWVADKPLRTVYASTASSSIAPLPSVFSVVYCRTDAVSP